MKLLENPKLTGASLILLLALNSALLVILIARNPCPPPGPPPGGQFPPPPPPPGPGPKEMLIHELNMTATQQSKLDTLASRHRARMEALMKRMKMTRDSLISAISSPQADSAFVKHCADQAGEAQAQIEQLNYWHFRDVRALCNEGQKPKFDSIIHDALHMMGPPPGQPGGPGMPPPPGQGPPPPPNGGPPMGPPPPHHPPH